MATIDDVYDTIDEMHGQQGPPTPTGQIGWDASVLGGYLPSEGYSVHSDPYGTMPFDLGSVYNNADSYNPGIFEVVSDAAGNEWYQAYDKPELGYFAAFGKDPYTGKTLQFHGMQSPGVFSYGDVISGDDPFGLVDKLIEGHAQNWGYGDQYSGFAEDLSGKWYWDDDLSDNIAATTPTDPGYSNPYAPGGDLYEEPENWHDLPLWEGPQDGGEGSGGEGTSPPPESDPPPVDQPPSDQSPGGGYNPGGPYPQPDPSYGQEPSYEEGENPFDFKMFTPYRSPWSHSHMDVKREAYRGLAEADEERRRKLVWGDLLGTTQKLSGRHNPFGHSAWEFKAPITATSGFQNLSGLAAPVYSGGTEMLYPDAMSQRTDAHYQGNWDNINPTIILPPEMM